VSVDAEEQALGDSTRRRMLSCTMTCSDETMLLSQSRRGSPEHLKCVLQEDLASYGWDPGLLQPLNEHDSKLPHATALSDELHVPQQSVPEAVTQTHVYIRDLAGIQGSPQYMPASKNGQKAGTG
jgi:hypothetical protein